MFPTLRAFLNDHTLESSNMAHRSRCDGVLTTAERTHLPDEERGPRPPAR